MTSFLSRPTRAFGFFQYLRGAALGAVLSAAAGGCADGRYSSTAEERSPEAYKALAPAFTKLGYRWDWSGFPTPVAGEGIQSLDAYGDIVVTQDSASKLSVIEANSGRVRWSNELATRATKFVGTVRDTDPVRGDRLISCSESEAFVLDVHTGNLLGRQHFDKVVNTRPLLVGPVAWFGTPDGEVLGHLMSRNVKFNGYQMPGSIERAPVRVGASIGAVSQVGEVAFVDATSGTLIGRTRIYGGAAGDLAAGDTLMYVASTDQSLYAFNTQAQTAWRKRTSAPLAWRPVLDGQTVYCTIADGGFTAFDALTGKERWSNPAVKGAVVAVRSKRLLVWDGKTMTLVDPKDGATIEKVELPGMLSIVPDKFEDGNLYTANRGGVVGKFIPR